MFPSVPHVGRPTRPQPTYEFYLRIYLPTAWERSSEGIFLKCLWPSLTAIAFQVCERNTGEKLHRQDLRFHPSSPTQITSQSQCIYVSLKPFFIPFSNPALLEEASGNVLQSTVHKATRCWKIILSREATPFSSIHAMMSLNYPQSSWGLQRCAWYYNVPCYALFVCLLFLQSWITERHKPNLGWPFVGPRNTQSFSKMHTLQHQGRSSSPFWRRKRLNVSTLSSSCKCCVARRKASIRNQNNVVICVRVMLKSNQQGYGVEVESIRDHLIRNQKESKKIVQKCFRFAVAFVHVCSGPSWSPAHLAWKSGSRTQYPPSDSADFAPACVTEHRRRRGEKTKRERLKKKTH